MALADLGGFAFALPPSLPVSGDQTNLQIDASGERIAFCFRVPWTGTITELAFRTSSVANAQTLRLGLETLDASGDPTGTQYGGSAVVTQVTPVLNTTYELALATPAAAVYGDWIAAVIQFDGTIGDVLIGAASTYGVAPINPVGPSAYVNHRTAGAWAHQPSMIPLLSVKYSNGSYAPVGCLPAGSIAAVGLFTTAVPDELGNIFQLPAPVGIYGAGILADPDFPLDLVLYDATNTPLRTASFGSPYRAGTGRGFHPLAFESRVDLTAGAQYRLVAKPTSSSSSSVYELVTPHQGHLDPWLKGEYCHRTARVDGGDWVDTQGSRFLMSLYGSAIDDGVGSAFLPRIWG